MTIKWVKVDPLVMNGEPFCYGTRLTVRNLLEMRANGLTPADMLTRSPELRPVGIAEAFLYASRNRERYASFFETDDHLIGPGFSAQDAAAFPEHLAEAPEVVATAQADPPSTAPAPAGGRTRRQR